MVVSREEGRGKGPEKEVAGVRDGSKDKRDKGRDGTRRTKWRLKIIILNDIYSRAWLI